MDVCLDVSDSDTVTVSQAGPRLGPPAAPNGLSGRKWMEENFSSLFSAFLLPDSRLEGKQTPPAGSLKLMTNIHKQTKQNNYFNHIHNTYV